MLHPGLPRLPQSGLDLHGDALCSDGLVMCLVFHGVLSRFLHRAFEPWIKVKMWPWWLSILQYAVVSTTVYQKKNTSNQWPHFVLALVCEVEQENNPSDQFSVSLPEILHLMPKVWEALVQSAISSELKNRHSISILVGEVHHEWIMSNADSSCQLNTMENIGELVITVGIYNINIYQLLQLLSLL